MEKYIEIDHSNYYYQTQYRLHFTTESRLHNILGWITPCEPHSHQRTTATFAFSIGLVVLASCYFLPLDNLSHHVLEYLRANIEITNKAQAIVQFDLVNVGVVLGRRLHEDDGVPHVLGEGLSLRLADDSLVLQVVLVAEDHERRQDPLVVRISEPPQTFHSFLHILQTVPGRGERRKG